MGVWAGHLGAAGLVIGGGAYAIPAAVVIAAPAVVGGVVVLVVWKGIKTIKKK